MADIARLTEVIEPEASALGFELVRVKLSGRAGDGERTLQVMAEDPATGQLVVEQCMALSRRDLRPDRRDRGSRRGADPRRLQPRGQLARHRPAADPREGLCQLGRARRERLAERAGRRPPQAARRAARHRRARPSPIDDRKAGRVEVPLAQIHSAKLVLTDKLIAATRPLDTSGVEELEELEEEKAED